VSSAVEPGNTCPMPQLLVVSQHARRYAELLAARGLVELKARYCETVEEARAHCEGAEILFGAPDLLAPLLEHCPRLRWVQSSWAGVTPLLACPRRDYQLTGVKNIFGPLMSEYVLGWLLAIERNILHRSQQRHWDNSPDGSLQGKLAGILGTGSIGRHVAASCAAFGMQVRGLNSDGRSVDGFDDCFPTGQVEQFAEGLDYLVALLPDTAATTGLVDASLLGRLRHSAILINAGRANCLVLEDTLAALASGQLRHAVLDVLPTEPLPEGDPLWQVKGLSITSHTAAPTGISAIVEVFCDNYARFVAGEPLLYPVDFRRGY